jgi:hypothetical protein
MVRGAPFRRRRSAGVFRTKAALTKDRLHGRVLATLVVLVQLAWGAVLVYLGLHFL